MNELRIIMEKFADSGWELISVPANEYLNGDVDRERLLSALRQADAECGTCGCELDPLYRRAIELLRE
ncbi:MAG TPA: hypothetical protein H9685_07015 [Firmicutes bacterium]|nr:hypothetical protein [Bacillota bacterium]